MTLVTDVMEPGVDELATTEMSATDVVERRRGLRIRETRPVKIFDAAAARYFGGRTEDISATGLRVELPSFAPVEPGDTLSVHVGLNERGQGLANRRQMIPARVVWVDRSQRETPGIEAGIEFLSSFAARVDAA